MQLHLATDHDLYLQYLASPSTVSSYSAIGSGDVASKGFSEVNQVHDASVRYIGKLFQKRLQVELLYGFHYQSQTQSPTQPEQEQYNLTASADAPFSLADFEAVAPCRPQQQNTASGAVLFNPCPVTSYGIGLGFYREQVLQRHQALAAFTLFVHALGLHAIKAGSTFSSCATTAAISTLARRWTLPIRPRGGASSTATRMAATCCSRWALAGAMRWATRCCSTASTP